MSEPVLTAECCDHLHEAFAIAAASPPEAVSGRLLTFLETVLGPVWTSAVAAIKQAVAAGAVTVPEILAFLATAGVTLTPTEQTLLTFILPLVLSLITGA